MLDRSARPVNRDKQGAWQRRARGTPLRISLPPLVDSGSDVSQPRGPGMLRLAIRYLVVAVVAAAVFAMLQGRDRAALDLAVRDAIGDGGERAGRSRALDEGDAGDLEQVIRAGPHGHFLVEAVVNGVPVDFMVDTGASHVVPAELEAAVEVVAQVLARHEVGPGRVSAEIARVRQRREENP